MFVGMGQLIVILTIRPPVFLRERYNKNKRNYLNYGVITRSLEFRIEISPKLENHNGEFVSRR